MATAKPTLVIPTNYTIPQQKLASRRKLAEAMLGQGLSPDNSMNSWAQVLGKLAQTWAGKSMQTGADKAEGELNQQILDDYNSQRTSFLQDAGTMDAAGLVGKYGNNPMLEAEVKPYAEAMAAQLKQNQELIQNGGVWARKGDITPGSAVAADPNDSVIPDGKGGFMVNPLKVTSSAIGAGTIVPENYPTQMQLPGMGRLATAMAGGQTQAQPTQAPTAQAISPQAAAQELSKLRPEQLAKFPEFLKNNGFKIKVTSPQEALQFPSGTPLILPDGTEGVVP